MTTTTAKQGFIPSRTANGEIVAIRVICVGGLWRNANGLVDSSEIIFATEFEAVKAGHDKYKRRGK